MKKTIEIFKPGKHTAISGVAIEFGEQDLQATVAAYNPALHEAPLVVGHPQLDGPAYGWVKSLSFADGLLHAAPDQVDAAFAEMVNKGHFKHVSASFYLPTAANNPVPGVYYLRHVGFLGAAAPAVKGLKAVSFGEEDEGVVEFGDWADQTNAAMWRRLRDWIIGKFGMEEADKVINSYDIGYLETDAAQCEPVAEIAGAMYAETQEGHVMDAAQLAADRAVLDKKTADFAEREKVLQTKEAGARHVEHIAFADGLVKEAKLLPAQKERTVALLDFAAGLDQATVIEFGEGDARQSKQVADIFKDFLVNQPKIVEFGEVAGKDLLDEAVVDFAAPPGYTVDAAGLATHNKAIAYQAKNPGIEYMTAVKAVQ